MSLNIDFKEFTSIIDRLTYMIEDDKRITYLMTESLCHILIKAVIPHMEEFQQNINMDSTTNDMFNELVIHNLTKKLRDYLKYEGEKDDRK